MVVLEERSEDHQSKEDLSGDHEYLYKISTHQIVIEKVVEGATLHPIHQTMSV